MAYTINLTDGTVFATIADGTINQIASGTPAVPLITLVGKNYAGYGEFLDENFVHLLESGSNTTAPTSPLTGQLWWDKTNNLLKIYSGAGFKVISGATSSASAPTTTVVAGDLWFDSSNQQLKVYTGSAWLVVGPGYTSAQGTSGAIPETILNNVGATKYITSLYVNNVRVGVVFDGASFTPQASLQAAFPTIYPGLTLSASVSGAVFAGSATNAQLLDSLDSSQFMRTDTNTATTGVLRVQNNTGMFVGVSNVFNVNTSSTDANVLSAVSGGNLVIQANVGGTTYNVARALGASGNFAIANAATVGTTLSVTGNTTGGNLFTGGLISATGNITGGNLVTLGLANIATASVTGNVQAGNLRSSGVISSAGNIITAGTANISAGNISISGVYYGDGSGLTNLGALAVGSIANGTSSIGIAGTGGNANVTIGGVSNVLVLTTGTAYFKGNANVTGIEHSGTNAVGNIGSSTEFFNTVFASAYNGVTVSATGNISGGNVKLADNGKAIFGTGSDLQIYHDGTDSIILEDNALGNLKIQGNNVQLLNSNGSAAYFDGNATTGVVTLYHATNAIKFATNSTGIAITGNANVSNNVSAVGNITGNYILGNGALLTGVITSVANINNGTSNVTILSSGGNVTVGVGGTANVAVYATTGEYVTGLISATGNVIGGNINTGAQVSATGNVTGGNVNTGGLVTATGNITGGNIRTGGLISATGNVTGGNLTVSTGNVTLGNIVNAGANGVGNIGSSVLYFNTVFASAAQAQYADLAERYAADAEYDPGTVVDLGGSAEITKSLTDCSDRVFGVISTASAYLMNSGAGNDSTHPPVAIVGRVPTKVIGPVQKGDRLVSAGNGAARAAQPGEATWFNVIGRALENKDSEELGMIEATVSVK